MFSSGQNLLLVGGMQARNNARVLVFGSSDMLSDEFYGKLVSQHGSNPTPSGNRDFVSNVISWAFKHTGDLRYKAVTHNKVCMYAQLYKCISKTRARLK